MDSISHSSGSDAEHSAQLASPQEANSRTWRYYCFHALNFCVSRHELFGGFAFQRFYFTPIDAATQAGRLFYPLRRRSENVRRSPFICVLVRSNRSEFGVRSSKFGVWGLGFGEPPREPRFDFRRRLSRSDSTELVEVFARPHNEKSVGSSALNLAPSHA